MRIAALPCQTVPSEPARAVLLHAPDDLAASLVVVAEADEHLVEDDVVEDLDAVAPRRASSANVRAWSQQRSTRSATPLRPSERSAAQTAKPRARRDDSGTQSDGLRPSLRCR